MKSLDTLIETLYTHIVTDTSLITLVGTFSTPTPIVAVAYNSVPIEYTLPSRDKCFIVYSIDDSNALPRETRTLLINTTLKFYVSGNDALALADAAITSLDGKLISDHYCSYRSLVTLPSGDVTIRFTLI